MEGVVAVNLFELFTEKANNFFEFCKVFKGEDFQKQIEGLGKRNVEDLLALVSVYLVPLESIINAGNEGTEEERETAVKAMLDMSIQALHPLQKTELATQLYDQITGPQMDKIFKYLSFFLLCHNQIVSESQSK